MPLTVWPKELATRLPTTDFTARYDDPIVSDQNLLWCGTFQICWDELAGVIGADPSLEGDPALGRNLNRRLTSAGDLDEASLVARAGFGRDRIVEAIREELGRKFGREVTPALLPDELADIDLLVYACLYKDLEFSEPFEIGTPAPFGDRTVGRFGLRTSQEWDYDEERAARRRRQVLILHRRDAGEYIVELVTKSPGDRLILARIPPARTLQETAASAIARFGQGEPPGTADVVSVPMLDFDLTRSFPELEGRRLLNEGFEAFTLSSATQNVRFRLNERGALLKSEAAVVMAGCAPIEPKVYEFCAPHLLMLMRRGCARPYFALWVADTSLLVPA